MNYKKITVSVKRLINEILEIWTQETSGKCNCCEKYFALKVRLYVVPESTNWMKKDYNCICILM